MSAAGRPVIGGAKPDVLVGGDTQSDCLGRKLARNLAPDAVNREISGVPGGPLNLDTHATSRTTGRQSAWRCARWWTTRCRRRSGGGVRGADAAVATPASRRAVQ